MHSFVKRPETLSLTAFFVGHIAQGVQGAASAEFLAYRILYQTVHARHGEASGLLAALRLVTSRVRAMHFICATCSRYRPCAQSLSCVNGATQMSEYAAVRHALAVRQAVYTDDYAAFFRLYAGMSASAPCLHYLVEHRDDLLTFRLNYGGHCLTSQAKRLTRQYCNMLCHIMACGWRVVGCWGANRGLRLQGRLTWGGR